MNLKITTMQIKYTKTNIILIKIEKYILQILIGDTLYIKNNFITLDDIIFVNKILLFTSTSYLFINKFLLKNFYIFMKILNKNFSKKNLLINKKARQSKIRKVSYTIKYLQLKVIKIIQLQLQFFNNFNKIENALIILKKLSLLIYLNNYFTLNYKLQVNSIKNILINNQNILLKQYINNLKKNRLQFNKKNKLFYFNKKLLTFLEKY